MIRMPGKSHRGPFLPLTPTEVDKKGRLERDVRTLAQDIGERNALCYESLCACADFIEQSLRETGLAVRRQIYTAQGQEFCNIEAELAAEGRAAAKRGGKGRGDLPEVVVVGAHYDTVEGSPGANDNGSGVAALLEMARSFSAGVTSGRPSGRTLRFVAFANEEAPFFMTEAMGSFAYARQCRERGERVSAMISLETIGYYSDAPGSQHYPFPLSAFYPSRGDFVAFVGNSASARLVRRVIDAFRRQVRFPSEGAAVPELIRGIAWSDQWAFWRHGYPALMVTDTAPFRYPYYHTAEDRPDRLCFDHLARVVGGLERVLGELADR